MMYKKISIIAVLCCGLSFYSLSSARNHVQTLNYAVRETLQQNPNALERQARLREAQAALKRARGEYFLKLDIRAAVGSGVYDSPYYDEDRKRLEETEASLVVVQPVFSGLSTYNLVKQRRADIATASFNEGYTREQLALAAAQAYLDVLRTARLKILTKENVAVHQEVFNKISRRYHGGGGNKTDVDLARGRLARNKSLLHTADEYYQNSLATFVQVIGFRAGHLQLPHLLQVPANLSQAKAIALQKNPELLAAQAKIKSAASAVAVTKAKFSPAIDLEVRGEANDNLNGYPGRDNEIKGLVVVRYNILNGGIDRAAVNQADANKVANIHNYQDTWRRVINNVTEVWNALIADRNRLRELQEHVKSTQDVLYGYVKQFQMSKRTLFDVLNIKNELFNSKVNLLNGEYALKNDRYALLANMGVLARKF